jgi:hypothetical protein
VSSYARIIARWEESFPPERMLTLFHDDIVAEPLRVLGEVCAFLGLGFDSSYFAGSVARRVNRSPLGPCPRAVWRHLAGKYRAEVVELRERFERHPTAWLAAIDRVLAAPV